MNRLQTAKALKVILSALMLMCFAAGCEKKNYDGLIGELKSANSQQYRKQNHKSILRQYENFSGYSEGQYQDEKTWIREASHNGYYELLYCCDEFNYAIIDNEFYLIASELSETFYSYGNNDLSELNSRDVRSVSEDEQYITVITETESDLNEQQEDNLSEGHGLKDIRNLETTYIFDAKNMALLAQDIRIRYKDSSLQDYRSYRFFYDTVQSFDQPYSIISAHLSQPSSTRKVTYVLDGGQSFTYEVINGDMVYLDYVHDGILYEIDYSRSVFDDWEKGRDGMIYLVSKEK